MVSDLWKVLYKQSLFSYLRERLGATVNKRYYLKCPAAGMVYSRRDGFGFVCVHRNQGKTKNKEKVSRFQISGSKVSRLFFYCKWKIAAQKKNICSIINTKVYASGLSAFFGRKNAMRNTHKDRVAFVCIHPNLILTGSLL